MYWEQILNEVSNKETTKDFVFTNIEKKPVNCAKTKKTDRKPAKIYLLGDKFKGVHFSSREGECMLLLLRGKTINGVAEALGLSPRTVEFYVKNMKGKVGCRTKSELISLILDSEFLLHID